MRIITWNCNMAFRKKAEIILALKPDILIVPECECPEKLKFKEDIPNPSDILWFGTNQHKGLAIFSYCDLRFKVLDVHNEDLRMIVPINVTGRCLDFNLFAIWANNPKDPDGVYIEQVWKAIHYYESLLTEKSTILIGDFNSNTIWDRKHRASNHSNVVEYLKKNKIYSSYHLHHKQIQGKEQHPTLYMYRHLNKPYHIDYCFMSDDLVRTIQSVNIGEYSYWIKYSDHMPVIIDMNNL